MLKGTGVSEGIGIGRILHLNTDVTFDASLECGEFSAEAELVRLENAIDAFIDETKHVAQLLLRKGLESEAEIMNSHVSLLEDKYLIEQMKQAVSTGSTAEGAIAQSFDEMASLFTESDDDMIRQRAADFRDIKQRLIGELNGGCFDFEGSECGECILFAEEISPSFAALVEKADIAAIAASSGGYTSHAAILLRAKEIPAVFGVRAKDDICDDMNAIVDGEAGIVIIDPAEEVIAEYIEKKKIQEEILELKDYYISEATVTACGERKQIYANVSDLNQARKAHGMGAEGIGLFRSEFLYMEDRLPTEEEQLRVYKSLGRLFDGSEVVIRTLDAGGDKPCRSLNFKKENNPFLGQRGIRFCLENLDIFKTQLRSLLRAAYSGNISICLPMVTSISEVRETKQLLRECAAELEQEGLEFSKDVPVGIMIETPAACVMADVLAEEVDFFSIGTNDLSGYVMAADRGNEKVSSLCSPFEPSLIRMISHVCNAAKKNKIEVSMCGEAASDIRLLPLLLSSGIDRFSVSGERIWRLRKEIAQWKLCDAETVSQDVSKMTAEEEVEKYLKKIQKGGKKENEY